MLFGKLSHPKCSLNQTGIDVGRLVAKTDKNGVALTEENVKHLLNSIDEDIRICALDDANVINLTIDDVHVSMSDILIGVSLELKEVCNSRHTPARAPLGHQLTIEVKIPRRVAFRIFVAHVRCVEPSNDSKLSDRGAVHSSAC